MHDVALGVEDMHGQYLTIRLPGPFQQSSRVSDGGKRNTDFCGRVEWFRGSVREDRKTFTCQTGVYILKLQRCQQDKQCQHHESDKDDGDPDAPKELSHLCLRTCASRIAHPHLGGPACRKSRTVWSPGAILTVLIYTTAKNNP
jgi:hypothetical protein